LLDAAFEERVFDLQPDEGRPAAEARHDVRLCHLPRRRIRDADVADLARANEVVERGHRLFDGRVDVPVVQPVEVDVVGLQAPQRALGGIHDRLATGAAPVRIAGVQVAAELGRDDQTVAARAVASDVVADDLLGVAARIKVRGVDEVSAELQVAVHDLLRLFDARAPAEVFAEGHRAEAQRADTEA
jgi:hypothetical protein